MLMHPPPIDTVHALMRMSPQRAIWFCPVQTVLRIVHENPGYGMLVLTFLAGMSMWPTAALYAPQEAGFFNGLLLSSLLSFGLALEFLQLFVGAFLIRIASAFFGGRAGITTIQTVIAWANIPIVALGLISLPLAVFAGIHSEWLGETLSPTQSTLAFTVAVAVFVFQLALIIWSWVIFLTGLAAVQGFSVLRAFASALLAWISVAALVAIAALALGYSGQLSELFFSGLSQWMTLYSQ
ncbi:MAG: YIP1 family protein [Pseudomonadota bacterium]